MSARIRRVLKKQFTTIDEAVNQKRDGVFYVNKADFIKLLKAYDVSNLFINFLWSTKLKLAINHGNSVSQVLRCISDSLTSYKTSQKSILEGFSVLFMVTNELKRFYTKLKKDNPDLKFLIFVDEPFESVIIGDMKLSWYMEPHEQIFLLKKCLFSNHNQFIGARNRTIIRCFLEYENFDIKRIAQITELSFDNVFDIIQTRFAPHFKQASIDLFRDILIRKIPALGLCKTDEEIISELKVDQEIIDMALYRYRDFRRRYKLPDREGYVL